MLSELSLGTAAQGLMSAGRTVMCTDGEDELPGLLGELEELGQALRAASHACEAATFRVLPGPQPPDRDICGRYLGAAECWQTLPPPPHERFAAALASLHEAADAARLAARRCDQAKQAVDALLNAHRLVTS